MTVRPFGGLPERSEPEGAVRGLGLVLPGRAYSPAAPLLDFARQALLQHRHAVRQVWWDSGSAGEDRQAWVREQAQQALAAETAPPREVVVVGKSLGSYATAYAAEQGWPAVWLTPLLTEPVCVAGIRDNPAPQLVIGGLADEIAWDSDLAVGLASETCEVHEVADADHGMCVAGDVVRSAEIHLEVTRRITAFLASLDRA